MNIFGCSVLSKILHLDTSPHTSSKFIAWKIGQRILLSVSRYTWIEAMLITTCDCPYTRREINSCRMKYTQWSYAPSSLKKAGTKSLKHTSNKFSQRFPQLISELTYYSRFPMDQYFIRSAQKERFRCTSFLNHLLYYKCLSSETRDNAFDYFSTLFYHPHEPRQPWWVDDAPRLMIFF